MDVDDDSPVADITLERYRLQELPADIVARLERRLSRDDELRRHLDALARSDEQIRASDRLERVAAGVRDRLAANSTVPEQHPWRSLVELAVAAGVVVLLVLPLVTSVPAEDGERTKGLQPSLALFRQVGAGSETLADGAVAHEGDVIRVGYRAAGRSYGVILSIDGRGHVTVHLPSAGDRAVPLRRENTVLLDQAYELDDAPRWERFYFVTATEPFMVAPIVASAHRAAALSRGDTPAALPLAAGLDQSVFSLQKESKP
jgi:hypothetical protein